MRYGQLAVAALVVCAALPASLHAASSSKPSCKKIHDAVWAGKTLEQITAEFDTDAETVMKCTQKRGKRKAAPKSKTRQAAKSSAKSAQTGGTSSTSSSDKPKSSSASSRKPSAPRSGPWPSHLP